MKRVTFILSVIVLSLYALGQSPAAIKYQAVARGLDGTPLTNQNISVKVSVLYDNIFGEIIYSESHSVETNTFGLFSVEIGNPDTVLSGSFEDIDWGEAKYLMKLEMDETGGSDYTLMGISQILSVPYSLNSTSLTLTDEKGKQYTVSVDTLGNLFAAEIQPEWHCGVPFVDERDGKSYNTVVIGENQCWMAKNLNYEVANSYCYQNDPVNCETYGRLYVWAAAVTACPVGWHLPDDQELKALEGAVDSQYPQNDPEWDLGGWRGFDAGKNLKSTFGWNNNGNGADLYGFGFLPAGVYLSSGSFGLKGTMGKLWSSSEVNTSNAVFRAFYNDHDDSYRGTNDKGSGFSVRCLKD